jgi:hypothetical protein
MHDPPNEDVRALGFAAPVQKFRDRIAAADALLIVTPEYSSWQDRAVPTTKIASISASKLTIKANSVGRL